MKRYILFFIVLLAGGAAKAQNGYNYYELGIGADASYIRGYTNITKQYYHPAFSLNGIYNFNPYVPFMLELQKGTLSGGGTLPSQDPYGRQYTNNYLSLGMHVDIQIGSMIDYEDDWFLNAVKGFYFGSGAFVIKNTNTVIRVKPGGYVFPGSNNSIDLGVPLRFGYEFKIYDTYYEPGYAIDIGYVHNFAFGEGLDGYDDPNSKFKNNSIDQYSQITIGFKYFFGNTVAYNKRVRNYGF